MDSYAPLLGFLELSTGVCKYLKATSLGARVLTMAILLAMSTLSNMSEDDCEVYVAVQELIPPSVASVKIGFRIGYLSLRFLTKTSISPSNLLRQLQASS